ncbi:MAG: molecular chaperone HscC [Pseudomonadota bacterium]
MIIGIDLGTTNSLVGAWRGDAPQLFNNVHGDVLTPSIVGLDDDGQILVGKAAAERLLTHPQLTVAAFKRYMGTQHTVRLGKREFRPEELSALVLKSLKADAEAALGETVHEAVITVPAYFSDAQRKATRIAGELAGLKVDRLLNEPTAAAMAYGLHQRDRESKFLVFDLGGGTFDVSILEMFDGVMEVRASAGDNFLGGEDFVSVLAQDFIKSQLGERAASASSEPAFVQQVRKQAELTKRNLSTQPQATMTVRWQDQEWQKHYSEDDFLKLATPLLDRLQAPLERALRDARIRAAELDEIVLAGGATRKPIVRKLVSRLFQRFPQISLNPDEVVAHGAAVQAGLKMRAATLEEVVLVDVAPYTLGVEVSKRLPSGQLDTGHYSPIIERNTAIPASRVESFTTVSDQQKAVKFEVYQGESRLVKDNVYLGHLEVPVPARKAGDIHIEVRFTYDVDGLLEVEATVDQTGDQHRVIIEGNPGVLSKEEVQVRLQKLGELKIHPRDHDVNRALMARGERLYQETRGDLRSVIGDRLAWFQHVLARQNPTEITEARVLLGRFFDEIEGERYL